MACSGLCMLGIGTQASGPEYSDIPSSTKASHHGFIALEQSIMFMRMGICYKVAYLW